MAGPVGTLNPMILSAPVPCAVPDMQDFDYVFRYAVGSDVRQGRKDHFARAGLLALASAVRGVDETFTAVVNSLRHIAGRCGIITPDVLGDAVEVLGGGRCPSQAH